MSDVITLEQSRKLYELGVRVNSYWVWWIILGSDEPQLNWYGWRGHGCFQESYPAYTAEELLKMNTQQIIITLHKDGWKSIESEKDDECIYLNIANDSLTGMLADKLIDDLKNGVVTAEEINNE